MLENSGSLWTVTGSTQKRVVLMLIAKLGTMV